MAEVRRRMCSNGDRFCDGFLVAARRFVGAGRRLDMRALASPLVRQVMACKPGRGKQFGGQLPLVYNLKFVQPQKSVEEGEARNGGSI